MRQLFAGDSSFNERPQSGRWLLLRWASWFWFFTATVAMFVGFKYPLAAGFPQSLDGNLFFILLTISHWHVLFFLLVPLVFVPLIILIPYARLVRFLAVLMASACVALVVVDAFSFSLYRFHLNGLVFSLLLSDAGGEVFAFDYQNYLLAALAVLAIIASLLWINRLSWRMATRENARGLGYKVAALLFIAFIAQNVWFAWADASSNFDITAQARLYPVYMPTRAEETFRELGWVDADAPRQRMSAGRGVVNYPVNPIVCSTEKKKPNIFFVVVDSWRYDELSEAVTPNLYAFMQESLVFSRHYSGGNNTRTGLFSLLYGLPATYWESFLDARAGSSLINAIQDADYQLAIYASAKLTGPEFDRTIFADVKNLRKHTAAKTVFGRDELANDEFIERMGTLDNRPVFGLLFYDAPHGYAYADKFKDHFKPSAQGMNYFTLNKNSDPVPRRNLYRNSVKSVDDLIGQAFDSIKSAGLWDNSIIIVTGDHGQEFNDNGLGYWGHNGNFTDAQIRVPLLVKWPGKGPATIEYTTTHYDVAPTLMTEVLGCHNSVSDYSVGTSLFSEESREGFVVGGFGDFGVRLDDKIYWVDKYGGIQVMSASNRVLQEQPDPMMIKQAIQQTGQYLR